MAGHERMGPALPHRQSLDARELRIARETLALPVHVVAAKAVAFGEDLKPEFKTYAGQVVKNAKALADVKAALTGHGGSN